MQLPPTFTKNYIAVLMGRVEENKKYIYVIELDIYYEVLRIYLKTTLEMIYHY